MSRYLDTTFEYLLHVSMFVHLNTSTSSRTHALSRPLYPHQSSHLPLVHVFPRIWSVWKTASVFVLVMFALDGLGRVKMRCNNLDCSVKDLQVAEDIAKAKFGSTSPMALRYKVTLAEVLQTSRLSEVEDLCATIKEQIREHKENRPLPKILSHS